MATQGATTRPSLRITRAASNARPTLAPECKVPLWFEMFLEHRAHRGVYRREPGQGSIFEAAPDTKWAGLVGAPWVDVVEARIDSHVNWYIVFLKVVLGGGGTRYECAISAISE